MICSPGTAPTATYKKPFLFRFSIAMQQKIGFFFQGARGTIIGFTARTFLTDINIQACNLV